MSLWNPLDQAFALRWTATLLHFLWQGAIVAWLGASLSLVLRRRSAHVSYAIHFGTLLAMAACVPVTLAWMRVDVPALQGHGQGRHAPELTANAGPVRATSIPATRGTAGVSSPSESPEAARQGDAGERPTQDSPTQILDEVSPAPAPMSPANASDAINRAPRESLLRHAAPWVAAGHLTGVVALWLRLLRGTWGGLRLRQTAAVVADRGLLDRLADQAARLGMKGMPVLRWSARVSTPVVLGILRPLILLPSGAATGLSLEQLEAIVAHELAHIRRHDLLANLLQRVIESLLFFHPAVWWVSRQVSRAREQACDEAVLAAGFARARYADALVRMAEVSCGLRERRRTVPATVLAATGDAPTEFKRRVLQVLGVSQAPELRPGRLALAWLAVLALSAFAAPGIGSRFLTGARAVSAQPPGSAPEPAAGDGRPAPRMLRLLSPDGSPARVTGVDYAQAGFPLTPLPR